MREQTANYSPVPQRASKPRREVHTDEIRTSVSPYRAGSTIGIHPEDAPTITQGRNTRSKIAQADVYEPPRTGSSVVRYRQPTPPQPQRRGLHWLFYTGAALAGITATIIATSILPPVIGRWNDDRAYGFPRTYQTDYNVGHGTKQHPSSHFIFLNNKGEIDVLELSGDSGQLHPHLYVVTTLLGDNAADYPVTGNFADMNGDGKVDVEVAVNGTLYVLYNDGTAFKLNP